MQKVLESDSEVAYNLGGVLFIEPKDLPPEEKIEARRQKIADDLAFAEKVVAALRASLAILDNAGKVEADPNLLASALLRMAQGK